MKFSLKRSRAISFVYTICSTVLPSVTEVKDLGVTLTSNLCFNKHVTNIVNKSFQMIGFLRRTLRPFKDPDVFRTMYFTLICSRLEYCSNIWSPSANYQVEKIERVQKKFLKFMCYKLRITYNVPYLSLCKRFNFEPLSQRRKVSDVTLLNKLFNNKINCPSMVESINFNVPRRRLRSMPSFNNVCRLDIRKNSPLVRCQGLAEASGLDVFENNMYAFKKSAKRFYCDY